MSHNVLQRVQVAYIRAVMWCGDFGNFLEKFRCPGTSGLRVSQVAVPGGPDLCLLTHTYGLFV